MSRQPSFASPAPPLPPQRGSAAAAAAAVDNGAAVVAAVDYASAIRIWMSNAENVNPNWYGSMISLQPSTPLSFPSTLPTSVGSTTEALRGNL